MIKLIIIQIREIFIPHLPPSGGLVQRSAVCAVGVPMHRDGGACFCTRGAVQDYAVITLFSRCGKPMTYTGLLN